MASIVELAQRISENTAKVNDYATKNNIVIPSAAADSPAGWNIPPEAADIQAALKAATEATAELQARLLGPREHFIRMTHYAQNIPVNAIIQFKLAKAVPIDGDIAVKELADQNKLNEQTLARLIRYAVNLGIFDYSKPNYIRHTAISRMLAENVDIHDYAGALSDEMWGAAAHTVNALVLYPNSQEPNETGYNLSNNTDLTLYQYLEKHPARARQFGNAMESFTKGPPFSLEHVVKGYPWGNLGDGLVVDIGGSNGFVAFALAEAFPGLKCIVQDLPNVIKDMKPPANLADRVSFSAHDFFEPQPVKDADVYFFRWILHNWPDKYAIQILHNLIPALKPGAKIVVCDEIMPPYGMLPKEMDLALTQLDINMMAIQNARLRSAEEWIHLFASADKRFQFKGITMPPGSALGLVEIEWTPTE